MLKNENRNPKDDGYKVEWECVRAKYERFDPAAQTLYCGRPELGCMYRAHRAYDKNEERYKCCNLDVIQGLKQYL